MVGAPGEYGADGIKGYVKVYHTARDGRKMTKLGQTLYGNATEDSFGYYVDITADGKTLAIGSPGFHVNKDRSGYVRVYTLNTLKSSDDFGDSWQPLGQDIVGEAIGDEFGNSVSLSGDGNILAVGGWLNDGHGQNSGHVRIYRLEDNGRIWAKVGMDIDGGESCDKAGNAVSMSADGLTVAIGAQDDLNDDDEFTGSTKVYRINSDGLTWEPLGQTIYGDAFFDNFGFSVDITADGQTLAVGSLAYKASGYVKVYSLERSNDLDFIWKQLGQKITGEAIGDEFGSSVSLSDDGKTLAVGAYQNDGMNGEGSGHVRIFHLDDTNSSWTQIGKDIDGKAPSDFSGYFSLSLSADGKTVAIGSYLNDDNGTNSGQVRVFTME